MEKGGGSGKVEYTDALPTPLLDVNEFCLWSFYRAIIAEFVATFLFLYVIVSTIIGQVNEKSPCGGVGVLGIAWSVGGMIFVLVYCTAGISGGHINPAVTFGFLVARKMTLNRAVLYMVAQCAGAVCGACVVKEMHKSYYYSSGGGVNSVSNGYTRESALVAEIIGTFVLVYTVFSATDPKRNARDSHIPVLAPLPIGLAVFVVILATAHITGTGINPARSFGPVVVYGHTKSWDDLWIFWVGPLVGAAAAATYHQYIIRARSFKPLGSSRGLSNTATSV